MSPILENLIGGAASVKLVAHNNYDIARINAFYQSQAARRGVPCDETLIRRVFFERLTGQVLFMVVNLAAMVATLMLATRYEGWAIATACVPIIAPLAIGAVENRIDKPKI